MIVYKIGNVIIFHKASLSCVILLLSMHFISMSRVNFLVALYLQQFNGSVFSVHWEKKKDDDCPSRLIPSPAYKDVKTLGFNPSAAAADLDRIPEYSPSIKNISINSTSLQTGSESPWTKIWTNLTEPHIQKDSLCHALILVSIHPLCLSNFENWFSSNTFILSRKFLEYKLLSTLSG